MAAGTAMDAAMDGEPPRSLFSWAEFMAEGRSSRRSGGGSMKL